MGAAGDSPVWTRNVKAKDNTQAPGQSKKASGNSNQKSGVAPKSENPIKSFFNGVSAGNFVVEPKYGSIIGFTEGRAAVVDDQGFKVTDETGQVLTDKAYSFIGMYQDGRAVFANTDSQGKYLYGYLDLQGKEVIPLQYQSADGFVGGKAVAQIKDYEYALIGFNGETLARYNYAFVGNLGEGLLAFKLSQNLEGLFGYIDGQGKVVQPPQYSSAGPFHEGRVKLAPMQQASPHSGYHLLQLWGLLMCKGTFGGLFTTEK